MRSDGTVFRPNTDNIGVESELYTRFAGDGSKNTEIEEWFGRTIDDPATTMIEHLRDPQNIRRTAFSANQLKAETVKALGYRVNSYIDKVHLPAEVRDAIARYLAALLVRHPTYLRKLIEFHGGNIAASGYAKNAALDNMLHLYELYAEKIGKSVFLIAARAGTTEFLYADGGLMVEEPWRTAYDIPFDIHAPLTPDLAIEVLPDPDATPNSLTSAAIMQATNQGVARLNRIILAGAERFVFSKQAPPTKFILKYFGKPAPKNIGYRKVNGRLETTHDPSRR
jgi:hypothetical protein